MPVKTDTNFGEKIKTVAAGLAIVSAVVAVASFIGFKPERKKLLEWEYVSKSSVVNPAAPGTEKIQILYENRRIKQLTVVTARLTNIGSIPIDESDVKDGVFPSVRFSNTTVISAETKEANRPAIKASAAFDDHSVRIQHGLLNPGDSIPVQILLEGDPGEVTRLPQVVYRIAGIGDSVTRYPSTNTPRVGVAFFTFTRWFEYLVIIVATFTPLLGLMAVAAVAASSIDDMYPERALRRLENSPELVVSQDPGSSLNEVVAKAVTKRLPMRLAGQAEQVFATLPRKSGEEMEDYVKRSVQALRERILTIGWWDRLQLIDGANILAFFVFLLITAALGLVLFAAWVRLVMNI
jgi:hypothetical protein